MKKIIVLLFILIFSVSIIGCDNTENNIETETQQENNDKEDNKNNKNNENNEQNQENEKEESYLEETITTNASGEQVVTNPNDILVLTNKNRNLSKDYEPEDLVSPDIPFVFKDSPVRFMRQVAAEHLEELFKAGNESGFKFYGRSGYRSYDIQTSLFNRYVEANGIEKANKFSAKPGQSEHQTGLAMDVTSEVVNNQLTESFGETADGKWLASNAHKFGFIIRYPKGKENITGYQYEPWHLRYVGKDIAKKIYDLNITLEEYFKDYFEK